MPSERIKRTPEGIAAQLAQAAAGVTGAGAAWPASAPTAAQLTTSVTAINTSTAQIASLKAQLATVTAIRKTQMRTGQEQMKKVDAATDMLYGPAGGQKVNFGLTPKTTGGALPPPPKLAKIVLTDGPKSASLFVDCETVRGCGYEWEWYGDTGLTQRLGNRATTKSEIVLTDLTPGQKIWVRVRPVRADQNGPWSDPDSRIVNG